MPIEANLDTIREKVTTGQQITTFDMGFRFSEDELRAAFDKVQNKEYWKLPIDAIIENSEIEVTAEAIVYFAGGGAEFYRYGNQTRVVAPGYYEMVGA